MDGLDEWLGWGMAWAWNMFGDEVVRVEGTDSNSVESIGLQLGDVSCTNAMGLDAIDV